MKFILNTFIAGLFLSSGLVLSAEDQVVLRYDFSPGYTRNPVATEILILDSGVVLKHETTLRDGAKKSETLGTISVPRLIQLRAGLDAIKAEDLVDLDAGKPKCVDAPSSQYSYVKKETAITFHQSKDCHTYRTENQFANYAEKLLKGFIALGSLVGEPWIIRD